VFGSLGLYSSEFHDFDDHPVGIALCSNIIVSLFDENFFPIENATPTIACFNSSFQRVLSPVNAVSFSLNTVISSVENHREEIKSFFNLSLSFFISYAVI